MNFIATILISISILLTFFSKISAETNILWQNQSTGSFITWFMEGTNRTGQALLGNQSTNWKIVGSGDFNRDGKPDILWQNQSSGDVYVMYMDGVNIIGGCAGGGVSDADWRIVGTADFNDDRSPDYLWQHQVRGDLYVWFIGFDSWWNSVIVMGGSSGGGVSDTSWKIVDTGDFNDDGNPDYLWQNQGTGDLYVWYLNGTSATSGVFLTGKGASNWKVASTGYFNSDFKPDILWQNHSTGEILVWFMDGVTKTGESLLSPQSSVDTNWKIASGWMNPNKVVFVTSVTGDGNLGGWADAGGNTGLEAGDAICQARAEASGLTGTFKAWLSDDNDDAYCRIHNLTGKKSSNCGQATLPVAAGPWVRTDGFPFGERIDQLLNNGVVFAPLRYDEQGNLVVSGLDYFTGTTADGTLNDSAPCSNWTSNSSTFVTRGDTDVTSYSWANFGSLSCATSRHLLCFQTGIGSPLPYFASAGKKAFLTSVHGDGNLGGWADAGGNTGLEAGDAICQARAEASGLTGTFKAWLSDGTTDAKDRITSDGPWVRLDGAKVADNKADLIDVSLFTSINLTETGNYIGNYAVWTGTKSDGAKQTNTCNNWIDGTSTYIGNSGKAISAGSSWSDSSSHTCDFQWAYLYCFED
jgi:hypothetical protein